LINVLGSVVDFTHTVSGSASCDIVHNVLTIHNLAKNIASDAETWINAQDVVSWVTSGKNPDISVMHVTDDDGDWVQIKLDGAVGDFAWIKSIIIPEVQIDLTN
jgi:hypothetical protein